MRAVCAGVALVALTEPVAAQTYPNKPIRLIVPWPPGGGADVLSRMVSPKLAEALGQQIIIDNRGGAAGNIGAEMAAKSPPDGYTIVFAYAGTHAINPSIYRRMPFKESDFAPIIWLAAVPQVLVVHPSLPVKNVKELIASRSTAGRIELRLERQRCDQPSHGRAVHHDDRDTKLVHVPYKGGGPAAIALMSGRDQHDLGRARDHRRPDQGGQGARARGDQRQARAGPAGPADRRRKRVLRLRSDLVERHTRAGRDAGGNHRRLNAEFNKIIATPDMRKRMIDNGFEPVGGPPEKLGEQIHAEIAKWAPVVKAAGVKVD